MAIRNLILTAILATTVAVSHNRTCIGSANRQRNTA